MKHSSTEGLSDLPEVLQQICGRADLNFSWVPVPTILSSVTGTSSLQKFKSIVIFCAYDTSFRARMPELKFFLPANLSSLNSVLPSFK